MIFYIRKTYVILFSVVLLAFVWAPSVQAAQTDIVLNKATLDAGYTVQNSTHTFEVGIRPDGIERTKKVRVHLRKGKKKRYSVAGQTLLSDIHIYALHSKQKVHLSKKVWIKLSYPAANVNSDKVIKYWDAKRDKWRALKTKDNQSTLQVSAALKHKTAVLGVFEKPDEASDVTGDVISGLASWYVGAGAASNDYPMNTRIRVTNANTGAFVDTTVVSTGPFVPGRVVDLSSDDFAAIASLSTGVIPVTVQRVE